MDAIRRQRRKLTRYVKKARFAPVATKDYVTYGAIIPLSERDACLRLIGSDFPGKYCVLWRDFLGGEECFRQLESGITPSYLLDHPGMKVRIHIMDCCGVSQGFFEPELFFGFIPDWEDRL